MSIKAYTSFINMKNSKSEEDKKKPKNDILSELETMRIILSKSKRKPTESEKI